MIIFGRLVTRVIALKTPKNKKLPDKIIRIINDGCNSRGKDLKLRKRVKPMPTNMATALITAPMVIKVRGSEKPNRKTIMPKIICSHKTL